jgi:hypothetical protein
LLRHRIASCPANTNKNRLQFLGGIVGKGDELVKTEITVPTRLSAKQKKLLEDFEKECGKKGMFGF